jgi:hypothetical protein
LNAAFAAFTAKSTSALSPSEISAIFFSVAGLSVENVFLLTASTNSLLMKSYQFKKNENWEAKNQCCNVTYFGVFNFLIWICHCHLLLN